MIPILQMFGIHLELPWRAKILNKKNTINKILLSLKDHMTDILINLILNTQGL